MMSVMTARLLAVALLLGLTRAEIIERMKAPVITQCDGLVQVYADCPEDMRREFQMPIASFASDTVKMLYRGLSIVPKRYSRAEIMIHVGDVRTNLTAVVARARTNDSRVVSRIYLPSPGYADIGTFRLELVKAFSRAVRGVELDDDAATALCRKSDPAIRIADERDRLEKWLAGKWPSPTPETDEENLKLMRRIIEPGVATKGDVLQFAARLFLYPPVFDVPFCGKYDCLSFRDAAKLVKRDPRIRFLAFAKSGQLVAFGGGRSKTMAEASRLYFGFLQELAKAEPDLTKALEILDQADMKLNIALEEAKR